MAMEYCKASSQTSTELANCAITATNYTLDRRDSEVRLIRQDESTKLSPIKFALTLHELVPVLLSINAALKLPCLQPVDRKIAISANTVGLRSISVAVVSSSGRITSLVARHVLLS
uniref:Uncharacterized protein n=1 Tax=Ascaris lumbricoides TaxID=6252 RepID=A0A0M3HNC4_ASCLU